MENKKKIVLLNILKWLFWYWSKAEENYELVERLEDDSEIIEKMLVIMKEGIDKVKNDEVRLKMQEWINKLEEMRKIEKLEREKEILEADNNINILL